MSLYDDASFILTPNQYVAGSIYALKPVDGSGDMSVNRSSYANRVDSSNMLEYMSENIPRLDYSNGSCPSILVEPQRTNLLTYSEQLDNLNWIKIATTITTNALISPSGIQNADLINETNLISTFEVASNLITFQASTQYVCTLYAKWGSTDTRNLHIRFGNCASINCGASFDKNGNFVNYTGGSNGTLNSYSSEVFGDGWIRLQVVVTTANVTSAGNGVVLYLLDGNNVFYSGNSTQKIAIWGAQLEAGSYATSYIPTDSSSVTRIADSVNKTGISDLIGQTEGTILFDFYYNGESKDFIPIELYNGSNRIDLYIAGNKLLYFEFSTGAFLQYNTPLVKGRYKICGAYKNNDFALYVNGVQVDTESSGTVPTCSAINISDVSFSLGTYKQQIGLNVLGLWMTRLPNIQLAQLTTL